MTSLNCSDLGVLGALGGWPSICGRGKLTTVAQWRMITTRSSAKLDSLVSAIVHDVSAA
jgi:hypothetical protein